MTPASAPALTENGDTRARDLKLEALQYLVSAFWTFSQLGGEYAAQTRTTGPLTPSPYYGAALAGARVLWNDLGYTSEEWEDSGLRNRNASVPLAIERIEKARKEEQEREATEYGQACAYRAKVEDRLTAFLEAHGYLREGEVGWGHRFTFALDTIKQAIGRPYYELSLRSVNTNEDREAYMDLDSAGKGKEQDLLLFILECATCIVRGAQ